VYAEAAMEIAQNHPESAVKDSSNNLDVTMDNKMPCEIFNWPDKDSLGFNESQMRAFKLALTKLFALIQGPPGTGKTYVGLKIARALLDNSSLWNKGKEKSPILMASYTNHALDQFLEGLLPMPGETIKFYFLYTPSLNLSCKKTNIFPFESN